MAMSTAFGGGAKKGMAGRAPPQTRPREQRKSRRETSEAEDAPYSQLKTKQGLPVPVDPEEQKKRSVSSRKVFPAGNLEPEAPLHDADKVIVNVGGTAHQTFRATLLSLPGTRLAKAAEDRSVSALFYDRHPGVFSMVMAFYRTGELHAPLDICGSAIKRELDFWGIEEEMIEPCCWNTYTAFRDAQKTLAELDEDIEGGPPVEPTPEELAEIRRNMSCWEKIQPDAWKFLEEPSTSQPAKIFAFTSFIFVLISIASFVMETHPNFRDTRTDLYNSNMTKNETLAQQAKCERDFSDCSEPKEFITIIDYICTAFFTLELGLRIFFSPSKLKFFQSPLNIIDCLALVPLYLKLVILAVDPELSGGGTMNLLKTILLLRIIRIFRIFKLMRQYSALKILLYAVKASFRELLMLTIFLMLGVVIFASLVYFAEQSQTKHFDNIPIGFWWAIVTMTTVGYGDTYPTTTLGYVVGTLCALCGVLVLALTIPIISNNFTLFYSHAQSRLKLPKEGKKKYEHNHWAKVNPPDEEDEEDGEDGGGGGDAVGEDGLRGQGRGGGGGGGVTTRTSTDIFVDGVNGANGTMVPVGSSPPPHLKKVAPERLLVTANAAASAAANNAVAVDRNASPENNHHHHHQQQQQQQPHHHHHHHHHHKAPSKGDAAPPRSANLASEIKISPNAIGANSQTSALLSGVQVVENLQLESAI